MKEITRIINAQITVIAKVPNNAELLEEKDMAALLKSRLDADDVVIKSLQDFVLDGVE